VSNTKTRYTFFFWIGIVLILGLNLLLWVYVNQVEKEFATSLSTRLTSTNKSLARQIDEELLGLIIPGERNTLEYFSIYENIDIVRQQDSLQSILILSLNGEILVASPEILSVQKEISHTENVFFIKAKEAKYNTTPPELISGEWFMSSYGPIVDIDGQVVGILVIEAKATYFETLQELRNRLILFSLINFLVIAIIAIFLFRLIDRAFKYQATIKDHEHLVQLGTMAASVAHEIRNPLGIIEGSNELIKKKYGQHDDEIFEYIPGEIKRLTEIIENFLNFARTPKINKSPFPIDQILTRIKIGINPPSKLTIENDGLSAEFLLFTDYNLLEQALLNIIKNAFEAAGAKKAVILKIQRQKGNIKFYIKDNGPGITETELEKIFQPFFTTKERGTGLGLAITKRIIELLDGQIAVKSVMGEGTEFIITLPAPKKKGHDKL
jgi:signal transduction histidine kinase